MVVPLNLIPFMDVIRAPETTVKSGYYGSQKTKIIDTIREYKEMIKRLYIGYDEKDKQGKELIREEAAIYKRECIKFIDKLSSHEYLMYIVLKDLEGKENRDIKALMFEVLFGKPNETFMKMINVSKEPIYRIEEDENGEEVYYNIRFSRHF